MSKSRYGLSRKGLAPGPPAGPGGFAQLVPRPPRGPGGLLRNPRRNRPAPSPLRRPGGFCQFVPGPPRPPGGLKRRCGWASAGARPSTSTASVLRTTVRVHPGDGESLMGSSGVVRPDHVGRYSVRPAAALEVEPCYTGAELYAQGHSGRQSLHRVFTSSRPSGGLRPGRADHRSLPRTGRANERAPRTGPRARCAQTFQLECRQHLRPCPAGNPRASHVARRGCSSWWSRERS